MTAETGSTKLKAFISYSRRDCSAFAQDLLVGLELLGFAPFLDRHDIAAGENWEARLAGLIQAADTIVYVVSPEAVTSPRCAWEIEKAIVLAKRIIPVVAIAVPEADAPPKLKSLNYIFFNEPHTMARSLDQLAKALRTDVDWIREHTRLAELAARWQQRDRAEALLLRGPELEAATLWLQRWKAGAPDVTVEHRTFIATSNEAEAQRANLERRRLDEMAQAQAAHAAVLVEREAALKTLSRRTTIGLISAGGLSAAAAGFAYWGADAESRFRIAREQAAEAEKRSIEEAIRKEAMREDLEGQIVAYAASPGGVAMDGNPGENSPFTKAALEALADHNTPVQAAFSRAAKRVLQATENRQRPFLATDMNGDVYLMRQPASRRRKALLFSADSVQDFPGKLENVEIDARAWEALFRAAGFEVQRLLNPKRADVIAAIEALKPEPPKKQGSVVDPNLRRTSLGPKPEAPGANCMVAVSFSGYGIALPDDNYIGLIDTGGKSDDELAKRAISVTWMQEKLRDLAAASLIVLDTNFEKSTAGQR